jgi:hypothetical protein
MKFLGRSVHLILHGLVKKYVEFHTFPYILRGFTPKIPRVSSQGIWKIFRFPHISTIFDGFSCGKNFLMWLELVYMYNALIDLERA